MKTSHLLLAAGAVVATGIVVAKSAGGSYPQHPKGPYGPVWGPNRPPGLPSSARPCSAKGAAVEAINAAAAGDDEGFRRLMVDLATTESSAMYGRPANNFDARPTMPAQLGAGLARQALSDLGHRPKSASGRGARTALLAARWSVSRIEALAAEVRRYRPEGDGLITAWGVFQWNKPAQAAGDHMADIGIEGHRFSSPWPWELDVGEEVTGPIKVYRDIWTHVRQRNGTRLDAARGVRGWHMRSTPGKRYLASGGQWHQAFYAAFDRTVQRSVTRNLRRIGIT